MCHHAYRVAIGFDFMAVDAIVGRLLQEESLALVKHMGYHQPGTSSTGGIPSAPENGCTDAERDAVRAYARREWNAAQEQWS
ncbi:hypothetical protein [Streptomyces sp. NPDC046727]|uniref:hypothetical protein n=1 Tax=Streptomyces sp. NPDC046727 TaxID=3155373 RepID=UPI0033D29EC6